MKECVSIVVFAYNRHSHFKNLLASLKKCLLFDKSRIFIFIDGYKAGNEIDKKKVLAVRQLAKDFSYLHKNTLIFFNKKNLGLYNSVVMQITKFLKKHLSVIVLEDDLVLDKNFLVFMNKALVYSKNKKNVSQVSGYSYPFKHNNNKAYHSTLSSCWGWGIYKKEWLEFINFISFIM
jgi:hypothetical protein